MGVSRPEVILKEIDGEMNEPFEAVMFDVEEQHQGTVMEQLGLRKGEMTDMVVDGKGRVRIEATVPSRGLIGFRSEFLTIDFRFGHHDFQLLALWPCQKRVCGQASKRRIDLDGQRYSA
jgi:predicted membrane GTPase involved in stress response